jgi:Glycoside hydrolase 123, catalytic domain
MANWAGRLVVAAAAVALAAGGGALRAQVRLWAVSDAVRVEPTSGRLLESRTDIHRDYPTGDYRVHNPVWDASTGTVSLRAARNEFVAFQVIVEAPSPVEDVDVSFDALTGKGGARIDGPYVALFQDWYTEVRKPSTGYEKTSLGPGWYPDALMPKRRSSLHPAFPFSIPDIYNNIPGQTNQAVWVDVFVPYEAAKAPAGRYDGELKVTWKGGQDSIAVRLDVWDFALPQESSLPGDVWNDSMRQMAPDEERAYYQLAQQHRFLPLVYGYRPEIQVENGAVKLDWSDYDSRLGPYLDGSAFTEKYGYWGPGYGVPVHHMMLPFNIEKPGGGKGGAWPIPLPPEGRTPGYEAVWKETARRVREHLDSRPAWRKVRKIAFLNGLDESYNEESYEKMMYYGRILHEAMGRDWFQYRIDGGYSREAMDKLSQEVDLWVCHTVEYDKEFADQFRPKVETWFYGPMIYEQKRNSGCGSNTFLDLDLLVNRGIGWAGWKYQTGWVEWEFDWNAYAAWYEAENYKGERRAYNGSGQMIYRGAVMGYREPIPSVRLKAMRRGLQDYEYFRLLAEKDGKPAADQLVDGIVYKRPFGARAMLDTEIWKNNPEEWDAVRITAGKRIAGE